MPNPYQTLATPKRTRTTPEGFAELTGTAGPARPSEFDFRRDLEQRALANLQRLYPGQVSPILESQETQRLARQKEESALRTLGLEGVMKEAQTLKAIREAGQVGQPRPLSPLQGLKYDQQVGLQDAFDEIALEAPDLIDHLTNIDSGEVNFNHPMLLTLSSLKRRGIKYKIDPEKGPIALRDTGVEGQEDVPDKPTKQQSWLEWLLGGGGSEASPPTTPTTTPGPKRTGQWTVRPKR
jgi:hypothetical protein